MKKAIFLFLALCFVVSLAYAAGEAATTTAAPEVITFKGEIIDNACAGAQKPEVLAGFVKTHTKECALKCAASGYAIFADGKLYKFDKDSNVKIEEFLKKTESKVQAVVTAKKVGEELSLVSIENQK